MKMHFTIAFASAILLCAPAKAADVKTPLACALGAASGTDQQLTITNSTPAALKMETIINVVVNTKISNVPGETRACFGIDAPLAPGAKLDHTTTLMQDAKRQKCSAFMSSAHPAIVHDASGSMMTDCDNE